MSTEPSPTTTPSPEPEGNPAPNPSPDSNPAPEGGDPNPAPKDDGDLMFGKKPDETDPNADPNAPKEGDKKEGEGDKKEGDEAGDEKPIEYKDFTMPEGAEAPKELIDELKAFGQEKKLSQEDAQRLVDMGAKMQQKNLDFWNQTKAAWREDVKKDPVLGGHNLRASIETAEQIVARFGGTQEEIRQMQDDLTLLGLGNKKSFIRFCNNIAKATADDNQDGSAGGGSKEVKSLAQRMWPDMASEKK